MYGLGMGFLYILNPLEDCYIFREWYCMEGLLIVWGLRNWPIQLWESSQALLRSNNSKV